MRERHGEALCITPNLLERNSGPIPFENRVVTIQVASNDSFGFSSSINRHVLKCEGVTVHLLGPDTVSDLNHCKATKPVIFGSSALGNGSRSHDHLTATADCFMFQDEPLPAPKICIRPDSTTFDFNSGPYGASCIN